MRSFIRKIKNNALHDDIGYWKNKDSECYKNLLDVHEQNAIAGVSDMGLIYDAVQLARFSDASAWAWKSDQAESHPALLTLCAAWQGFRNEDECAHEARIPYIQIFLGTGNYIGLTPETVTMPTFIQNESLRAMVRESSILFGDHFLVTFLAGRKISASKSIVSDLIHHTVHNKPLIRENLFFSDERMTVSCQILKGLYEFPKRFPSLWQYLKKQREVTQYEIQ